MENKASVSDSSPIDVRNLNSQHQSEEHISRNVVGSMAPNPSNSSNQLQQQQPSGAPNFTADPEKLKLLQQQLVLLLHAHRCQKRESQANNRDVNWHQCVITHCRTMKNVLQHMTTCTVVGKNCTVPHCSFSRQIISHWRHCNKADCPVCLPLKQAEKNRLIAAEAGPAAAVVDNAQGQMVAVNVSPPNSSSGTLVTTTVGDNQVLVTPATVTATVSATTSQQLLDRTDGGPPNILSGDNRLSVHQLPGGLQPEQVTANPVQGAKEWHQSITPVLRNHFVCKIIRTIFPTPGPQAATIDKPRQHYLVNFAKKIECDVYGKADSQTEYYRLLAKKIYNIRTDLEVARQKHKEQRQLQLQQQQQAQQHSRDVSPNVEKPSGGLQPEQLIATPVQGAKEWHQSVTPDIRTHLIHRMLERIFPTVDIHAILLDDRMQNVVTYAKKIESDTYEMANSKSEYHQLLKENFCKVQKILEEKRQKRKEQQQQ